ncbi:hypothetical protein CY34DRAFT_811225 [Suillus luteus UH-Slu-Lm8-n1]|uniref:Uncharacterized protein n=1 Tax=Suillus luteus UH-Slu-Lm8-n1 TaxID=930992 RepID=A0A0D0AEK5_9AGAM|nr:hypothetical protein CY34DRAFT_811225 [Suillus luteus UH-Slu-Lm8-n1]
MHKPRCNDGISSWLRFLLWRHCPAVQTRCTWGSKAMTMDSILFQGRQGHPTYAHLRDR